MATGLTDTTGYYELLGIEKGPQTSQDDIKKAWRKAALRLHPDRNPDDPDAENRFKQTKDAYDVLSDPEKRATYDQHGIEGLKLKEAMDNMDPSIVLEAFVQSGWITRCVLLCTVSCCCGFLMIIPIFLILKVDASISWGWPAVFSPLFIFSGISVCVACAAAIQPEHPREAARANACGLMYARTMTFLSPLLSLIYLAVLSVYLEHDGRVSSNFAIISIPAFLNEAIGVAGLPCLLSQQHFQALVQELGSKAAAFPFKTYPEFLIHHILIHALRILQWVLLCAQIAAARPDKMSWWTVLLPVWIAMGYGIVRIGVRMVRMRSAARLARTQKNLSATDEDEREEDTDNLGNVATLVCAALPWIIGSMLLAARLDRDMSLGVGQANESLAVVFAPVFIQVGLLFCILACAILCIRQSMRENYSQEVDEEMGKEGGGEGGGGDGEAAERSHLASAHEEPPPERDTSDTQHPPLETSPTLIPPAAASTVIVAAVGGNVTLSASQLEPTPLPSDTHLDTKPAPYARLESEFAQPASVSEIQVSSERLPPGMLPLHTPLIFHATSTPRHPPPPLPLPATVTCRHLEAR